MFTPHQRNSSQQTYFTICHYLALNTDFHSRALTILLCHRFIYAIFGGIGISTDCPSSTPFGLNLGPDLPWADEPSPGILRLSTVRILISLSLLMPAFSLLYSPPPLSVWLLPVYIAPLPIRLTYPHASVLGFSPVKSSAHLHSTSELLRTLLMCGCF